MVANALLLLDEREQLEMHFAARRDDCADGGIFPGLTGLDGGSAARK